MIKNLVILKFLTSLTLLMNSCGLYYASTSKVKYSKETLGSSDYFLERFPDTLAPCDTKALEEIIDSIDYKGKASTRVLIAAHGEVKDWEVKHHNLKNSDLEQIVHEISRSEWLPFSNSNYGISRIEISIDPLNSGNYGNGWVVPMWPRPTKKGKL